MTAEPCTATVTVVGLGTFTCERRVVGHEVHDANLPNPDKWAAVSWTGDAATIRPPGTRGGGA